MLKMKVFCGIFLLFIFAYTFFIPSYKISRALDCDPQSISNSNESDRKIIEEICQKKISDAQNQKNTLNAQLDAIDGQIYLTTLRIEDSKNRIDETEKEMQIIESRIGGLDTSLDYLSKLMLNKIVEGYKKKTSLSVIDILLNSSNADSLIDRIKYMQTVQNNNQKLLVQVQETKLNFEQQKALREKKKLELGDLINTLNSQKTELNNQQDAKKILIEATQRDEALFQSYLAQVQSFKSFVISTGVGIIPPDSLGTGEGGWYYSQRDSRWASLRMGNSNESVLDVGCFITSVSMVMKFYGHDFNPSNISSNPDYFLPYSAYMYLPTHFSWPGGLQYHNIDPSEITSYLNRNVPVIAGVRGSTHYIVLKKTDGGDFIMNDPIYGPDIKVSTYYSLSGPYGVFE